ncbi:MAG: hypothetical protein U0872_04100 [Planctomycetaceae bacterium]
MISFPQGLAKLPIVLIVVVGLALIAPIRSARGIGSKKLFIHFTGTADSDSQIRVAAIREKNAAILLVDPLSPEMKWQPVSPEESTIECTITFTTQTTGCFLFSYGKNVVPYGDSIAVQYIPAHKPPRYRVIPFPWPTQSTFELTISREPPNDDESWKPQ